MNHTHLTLITNFISIKILWMESYFVSRKLGSSFYMIVWVNANWKILNSTIFTLTIWNMRMWLKASTEIMLTNLCDDICLLFTSIEMKKESL